MKATTKNNNARANRCKLPLYELLDKELTSQCSQFRLQHTFSMKTEILRRFAHCQDALQKSVEPHLDGAEWNDGESKADNLRRKPEYLFASLLSLRDASTDLALCEGLCEKECNKLTALAFRHPRMRTMGGRLRCFERMNIVCL